MKEIEFKHLTDQTSQDVIDYSLTLTPDQNDNKLTLYGNPYYILYPKKLGNHHAFCFIKTYPLITIGPDSNDKYM